MQAGAACSRSLPAHCPTARWLLPLAGLRYAAPARDALTSLLAAHGQEAVQAVQVGHCSILDEH